MSWGLTAVAGATLVSGYMGAKSQSSATGQAAQTQAGATAQSIAAQERMFNKQLAYQKPYMQAGQAALPYLKSAYKETPGLEYLTQLRDLPANIRIDTEDPMYQWQLEQQNKAIDQAAAARGMYGSGAAIEAQGEGARQLGAEESQRQYTRQYGRLLDLYNMQRGISEGQYSRALNLANIGRGSATTAGAGAIQTGAGIAGTTMSGGQNIANLQALGGQQQGQMYGQLAALPTQMYGMYQTSQFLNQQNPWSFNSPASAATGYYGPTR